MTNERNELIDSIVKTHGTIWIDPSETEAVRWAQEKRDGWIKVPAKTSNSFKLVTGAYERAHGKKPRGNGFWLINESKTRTAFERDLVGGMRGFRGTLTEVKRQARTAGLTGFWAVLP